MKSKLKRFSLVCVALLLLVGCDSTNRLIKKHDRVKTKLLSKGVTIPKDTTYITKSDTVTAYYMRNDTIVERITITDTVTLEPNVIFKTRWQTRYETKWKYKYKTKYIKQQAKVEKAKNRKGVSWLWLVLLILGFFVYLRLTK